MVCYICGYAGSNPMHHCPTAQLRCSGCGRSFSEWTIQHHRCRRGVGLGLRWIWWNIDIGDGFMPILHAMLGFFVVALVASWLIDAIPKWFHQHVVLGSIGSVAILAAVTVGAIRLVRYQRRTWK